MQLFRITCLLFFVSTTAHTQRLFLNDGNNQLYTKDITTGAIDSIVDINSPSFSDISFHPNGKLYGIRANGNLFKVDTANGGATLIHVFENQTYNSLTTAADGTFYTIGSSGELRSYHLETDEEVFHGVVNTQAGGDLTFVTGELYLGNLGARITLINLDSLSNSQIVLNLNTLGQIVGLSSLMINCDSVLTYALITGLSSQMTEVYRINFTEGTFEFDSFLPFIANGSAFFYEHLGSNDSLPGLILDSVVYDLPLCTDPITDVQFFTSHGIGDLHFILNDSLSSSDGFFSGLAAGNYSLTVSDELGCQVLEDIVIECEEVNTTSYFNGPKNDVLIYPNPSKGLITIQASQQVDPASVRVYSPYLKTVPFLYQQTENGLQLDLSSAHPGLYYIQLNDYLQRVIIL